MKLNRLLLLALAMLYANASFAQGWEWIKASAGGYVDGLCATTDKHGHVYVAGVNSDTSSSFSGINVPKISLNTETIVAKYDTAGNIAWAKSTGMGDALPISMTTDPQGNIILLGTFNTMMEFDTFHLYNSSSWDCYFITKLDSTGKVLWLKKGINTISVLVLNLYFLDSSANFVAPGSITTDTAGNIYTTMSFSGITDSFGSYTLTNTDTSGNTEDIALTKLDAQGNIAWVRSLGGNKNDMAFSIAVTPSGNCYICGTFTSATMSVGSTTLDNNSVNGTNRMFIAEYDASGGPVWASAASSGNNYASGLATTRFGDVYLLGGFEGSALMLDNTIILNHNSPHSNFALVKYNAAHQIEWYKTGTGTENISGYSVASDACGNAWISGGLFHGNVVDYALSKHSLYLDLGTTRLNVPAESFDPLFIASYDPVGVLIRSAVLPSGGDDYNTVACDAIGNAYIFSDYYANIPVTVNNITLPYLDTFQPIEHSYIAKYLSRMNCFDTVRVEDQCEAGLVFPNSFTPNNDGKNDLFGLLPNLGCPISSYLLVIYNRWGQRVYMTTDPAGRWDGRFNNALADLDVYMYYAKYEIAGNGKEHFQKGDVTLIR